MGQHICWITLDELEFVHDAARKGECTLKVRVAKGLLVAVIKPKGEPSPELQLILAKAK